ncbi:hypothetical protein WAF17_03180 [Bernardetia sp. ABR2-2B]|uniref:hypothetical protein n=1 Tax=Bernardetia sp. ABR2-2B TaxID=3127472 RepID=UPI0030D46A0C
MKHQNYVFLLFILICFSCQGEKKEQNTTDSSTEEITSAEATESESSSTTSMFSSESEYFPIKEGNSWTHATTKSEYAEAKEYTTKVLDEGYTKNGKDYLTIKQTYKDGTELSTTYARTDDEGNIYSISPYIEKGEKEFLALPADIDMGKTWTVFEGMNYKVTSMDATVETPTKKYTDCLLIETVDEDGKTTMKNYYLKGIGSVAVSMDGKLNIYLKEYDVD